MLARLVQRWSLVDGGSLPGSTKAPITPPSNRMVRPGQRSRCASVAASKRNADAGKHHLAFLELARAEDRQQFRRGMARRAQSSKMLLPLRLAVTISSMPIIERNSFQVFGP